MNALLQNDWVNIAIFIKFCELNEFSRMIEYLKALLGPFKVWSVWWKDLLDPLPLSILIQINVPSTRSGPAYGTVRFDR